MTSKFLIVALGALTQLGTYSYWFGMTLFLSFYCFDSLVEDS